MCKNWKTMQNGRFWESPHGPRALACAMACGPSSRARLRAGIRSDFGTGQSRAGLGAWPVALDGGPYQTLLCSWVQFSGPASRRAFGRVNASRSILWYEKICAPVVIWPLSLYETEAHKNTKWVGKIVRGRPPALKSARSLGRAMGSKPLTELKESFTHCRRHACRSHIRIQGVSISTSLPPGSVGE